jgi:D-mannonate dehydratase
MAKQIINTLPKEDMNQSNFLPEFRLWDKINFLPLRDHMGRWTGVFHERIARKGSSDFYRELSLLVDKFVAYESEMMGDNLEKIK